MKMSGRFLLAAALLATALLSSCFGGGGGLSNKQAQSAGDFKVLTANVENGDIWALNRPIVITFNHPVDFGSVSFGSVILRPKDPAIQGRPVTGTFELDAASGNKALIFRPTCPTDLGNTNGGFFPGGYNYELALPTRNSFGTTVLRDTAGHSLTVGLTRQFRTPIPPTEPLFIDPVTGPPRLISVIFPAGLNLYSSPNPTVQIRFNQPIDASPANLNTGNLYVLYSDGERGTGQEFSFTATNKVPGVLFLVDNCTALGATVHFSITGVLPPNRNLKLVVSTSFADLSGDTNSIQQESALHPVPDLASYYGDGIITQGDETVDEFSDFYATSSRIDSSIALTLPPADFSVGKVSAAFDYPGQLVGQDRDMVLKDNQFREIWTTGTFSFTDSNGRGFTAVDGVLEVDDFTIEAGSTLRGRGDNPLVIYANGTVRLHGTLDVSGNNAKTPIALNAPQIPEPGALGECGGGSGGTASASTTTETFVADSGTAAFGSGAGGGGGEGSVTWVDGNGRWNDILQTWISSGGAGGTFSPATNLAVKWNRWAGEADPRDYDNAGPDVRADRHTVFNTAANIDTYFKGGENGLRGNSWGAAALEPPNLANVPRAYGGYGMVDLNRDTGNGGALDDSTGGLPNGRLDPAWISNPPPAGTPPFDFGHPTNGADPGLTNASIFSGLESDNFWGRRVNFFSGAVTDGELLAPWAGAGGGASGDSQIVIRLDLDGDSFLDPLGNFFPDPSFPTGTTISYWKGAPGGGGGGQLQVMAIGPIILGPQTKILANGGIGNAGESTFSTTQQVSGSGGGSGGHVILHSATGLDLSAIDVGANPITTPPATPPELVQAIGGRRGWVVSTINPTLLPGGVLDGNSDFMIGRGGAGSNGVIQIHVPDPLNDIAWHPNSRTAITNHITRSVANGPVDTDRLEEVLDLYSAPRAFSLIPVFAPKSQYQSTWVDTGLAELHNPGAGPYPDFANLLLQFSGVDPTSGLVLTSGDRVIAGQVVASGAVGGAGAGISDFQVTIPNVNPDGSNLFSSAGLGQTLLRNANLLVGYDFMPASNGSLAFEIASARYNRVTRVLTLTTSAADGSMASAILPGNPTWSIRQKFLRVSTTGQKDRLPADASVKVEFQGAEESGVGTGIPGTPTAWVTDLSLLAGKRFIRYRVTFDIDAQASGVTLSSERPAVEYVKLPFVW